MKGRQLSSCRSTSQQRKTCRSRGERRGRCLRSTPRRGSSSTIRRMRRNSEKTASSRYAVVSSLSRSVYSGCGSF